MMQLWVGKQSGKTHTIGGSSPRSLVNGSGGVRVRVPVFTYPQLCHLAPVAKRNVATAF